MKSAMNQICSLLNPDNTMTVNRLLAHTVGIPAAVVYTALISKYVYYEQNELIAEDGWFYSTVSDLEESTTLGIKAQRSAIRTLEETGLIRCEMKGMPAMRYFFLCYDADALFIQIKKGQARLDKIRSNMAARKAERRANKVHHRNCETSQQFFNVENVETRNSGSGVFNSDMLKTVGTTPCECPSAFTRESRKALTSERPSALAKLLRENNGDEEIIRLRSALDMLDRENAELKKQNEYLEERVCCLEKRLWDDSGKNAEKLRDMTSFPSAESSESAEE